MAARHYTRIYRIWRRWVHSSCMDAIFAGSVAKLHQDDLLDTTVIHDEGTTTAAKKGGDNLGFTSASERSSGCLPGRTSYSSMPSAIVVQAFALATMDKLHQRPRDLPRILHAPIRSDYNQQHQPMVYSRTNASMHNRHCIPGAWG